MKELRNSILLLLFYLIAILGVSLIQYVEFNFIDFEPAFFIMFALAGVAGIFVIPRYRPSIYVFLSFLPPYCNIITLFKYFFIIFIKI